MLDEPDEAEVSDEVTEARIRRSLGLMTSPTQQPNYATTKNPAPGSAHANGGGPIQRRRFVRDGEVPVVILHPKSEAENRTATALADMTRLRDSERAARLRAEQALNEAQATIQMLRTRIAHAEIAKAEITQTEVAKSETNLADAVRAELATVLVDPIEATHPEQFHERHVAPHATADAVPGAASGATPVTIEHQAQPRDETDAAVQHTPSPRLHRTSRARRQKQIVTEAGEEPTPVKWWR